MRNAGTQRLARGHVGFDLLLCGWTTAAYGGDNWPSFRGPAGDGLARPAKRTWPDGRAPSLRWILCHMIEEYARHNGHADLLRESIDGATGE